MSAARLTMPPRGPWATVAEFLDAKTHGAAEVSRRLTAGEVVFYDGTPVAPDEPYRGGQTIFLYRDLPEEVPVPGSLDVLHRDDDIVVADKPHFLATMPRGTHVTQTAVVQLRRRLSLPALSPAHRLDRLTAGVLLLTARPELRAAYQLLFQRREAVKTYLAVAPLPAGALPEVVRSRIVKPADSVQAVEVPGEVNAETWLELLEELPGGLGLYRLRPTTGRTHQLRVHLSGLGLPIVNDPLYPAVAEHRPHDFTAPLQLLAESLTFTDPLSGEVRTFTSTRRLALGGERRESGPGADHSGGPGRAD